MRPEETADYLVMIREELQDISLLMEQITPYSAWPCLAECLFLLREAREILELEVA